MESKVEASSSGIVRNDIAKRDIEAIETSLGDDDQMPAADEHTDEQKLAILIALLQKKPQMTTTMKERIAANRSVEVRGQVFSVSILQQAVAQTFRTNEAEVEALLDKAERSGVDEVEAAEDHTTKLSNFKFQISNFKFQIPNFQISN